MTGQVGGAALDLGQPGGEQLVDRPGADERSVGTPALRLFLVAGVLGGFTTFSTFGMETWRLVADGALLPALLNPLVSLAAGLVAVAVGVVIARAIA